MFRNRLLSTTAYFMSPDKEGEGDSKPDTRSAAQKERDSIVVTSSNDKPEIKEEVKEEENKDEVKEPEDKTEEIKTNEDKIEELENEKELAKTDKEKEKFQKRINKLTAQNSEANRRIQELEKQVAAKPDDEKVLTEDEVEQRAEAKANQKIAIRDFNASVDRIVSSCAAIDEGYKKKIDDMCDEAGSALPGVMIGILDDLDKHGGPVLMYLAANPDEYEDIYVLSPAKMALKLKEIEAKTKVSPKKKDISKVPEPKDPVHGKGSTPESRASEKDDMATFVAKRNREVEERRKAKLMIH